MVSLVVIVLSLVLTLACALRPGRLSYLLAAAYFTWVLVQMALVDVNYVLVARDRYYLGQPYWWLMVAGLLFSTMGLASSFRRAPAGEKNAGSVSVAGPESTPSDADSAAAASTQDTSPAPATSYGFRPTDPTCPYVMVEPPEEVTSIEDADVSEKPVEPMRDDEPSQPEPVHGSGSIGRWIALLVLVVVGVLGGLYLLDRSDVTFPLESGSTAGGESTERTGSDGGDPARGSSFSPLSSVSEEDVVAVLEEQGLVVARSDSLEYPDDFDALVEDMWNGEVDCVVGYEYDGSSDIDRGSGGFYVVWPPAGWVHEDERTFRSVAVVDTIDFWHVTDVLYQAGYYSSADVAPCIWTSSPEIGDVPCFAQELMSAMGSLELVEGDVAMWELEDSVFEESAEVFDGEEWFSEGYGGAQLLHEYLSDWFYRADASYSVSCGERAFDASGPA